VTDDTYAAGALVEGIEAPAGTKRKVISAAVLAAGVVICIAVVKFFRGRK
jgi:hypothetical protein